MARSGELPEAICERIIGLGRRRRQFFRESMNRLIRSLGYRVETFPSAADLLASPRLGESSFGSPFW
jgi:hypothetical protein